MSSPHSAARVHPDAHHAQDHVQVQAHTQAHVQVQPQIQAQFPTRGGQDRGRVATAHDGLVERLDEQVREAVRREGVDPQRDAALVRRIAEDVVRAHDERSLTGVVAPVSDAGAMVSELLARVSGYGPLQPFLDDPTVEGL